MRDMQKNRLQGQNMAVYNYYDQLKQDRDRKERELAYKLVEEPAIEKDVRDELRRRKELQERHRQNQVVKDSLVEQIEKHERDRHKIELDREGYSYGVIASMFEDKRKGYDKNEYLKALK